MSRNSQKNYLFATKVENVKNSGLKSNNGFNSSLCVDKQIFQAFSDIGSNKQVENWITSGKNVKYLSLRWKELKMRTKTKLRSIFWTFFHVFSSNHPYFLFDSFLISANFSKTNSNISFRNIKMSYI